MEMPDLSRLANTLKRAEFGTTDKVYIGLDDVVTDKIGQIWPATFINSRDRTVIYYHSRIVESLRRENEELKAKLDKAKDALRFYALRQRYEGTDHIVFNGFKEKQAAEDRGQRARTTLEEIK